MYLKPYFYYRQQYSVPSKSSEDSIDSTENSCEETSGEENSVSQGSEQTGARKQPVESMLEPGKEKPLEPKSIFEHSRFQEVAPGVFQFKHPRPNMLQPPTGSVLNHDGILTLPQPDKKPVADEFVRIGTFPGVSDYGLPVYQFT